VANDNARLVQSINKLAAIMERRQAQAARFGAKGDTPPATMPTGYKKAQMDAPTPPGVPGGGALGRRGAAASARHAGMMARARSSIGAAAGALPGAGYARALATPGGAALAAGTAAALFAGGGAVNVRDGGGFATGGMSKLTGLAQHIPIFGELSGAAGTARIQTGAAGDLNSLTNSIARYGGADAVTPKMRAYLADQMISQNRNMDKDRRRNAASINDRIGDASEGQGPVEHLIGAINGLAAAFTGAKEGDGGIFS